MRRYMRDNQQGATIVIVLMLLIVLAILGTAAISMANSQTKMVTWHQQREQALQYAEAGIHSYIAELSVDPNFFYTAASEDMQGKSIAYANGYYKIVCTAPSIEDPYINVTSTGWNKNSENIKRTVTVKLQKKDLLQNALTTNTGSDAFWYTNRYIRGDRIYGPLHINGDLVVNGKVGDAYDEGEAGPRFYGKVTYSGKYTKETGISWFVTDTTWFDPILNPGPKDDEPEKVPLTGMPSMNENLKLQVDKKNYFFQGRTCININASEAGSTLTIRKQDGTLLENVALPSNGIIYVEGKTGNNKWGMDTGNVFVSGTLNGKLTIAAENDIYITATDPTNWDEPDDASTPANNGGVTYYYLTGKTMTGDNVDTYMADCDDMLGLIANRNVRILHFYWPKADGYWNGWGTSLIKNRDVAPGNMNIHAAICAVTGSFEYEEHRQGDKKGELTVVGSIIQNRTGPLAGYSINIYDFKILPDFVHDRLSGYGRTFIHDPRMMYQSPPSFMEPTSAGWEMIEWKEVSNPD